MKDVITAVPCYYKCYGDKWHCRFNNCCKVHDRIHQFSKCRVVSINNKRKELSINIRGIKKKDIKYLLENSLKNALLCPYCGFEMEFFSDSDSSISIDHIIPLSKGGDNSLSNLTLCCRDCNTRKDNPRNKGNELKTTGWKKFRDKFKESKIVYKAGLV